MCNRSASGKTGSSHSNFTFDFKALTVLPRRKAKPALERAKEAALVDKAKPVGHPSPRHADARHRRYVSISPDIAIGGWAAAPAITFSAPCVRAGGHALIGRDPIHLPALAPIGRIGLFEMSRGWRNVGNDEANEDHSTR